jgi:hypothetical protein
MSTDDSFVLPEEKFAVINLLDQAAEFQSSQELDDDTTEVDVGQQQTEPESSTRELKLTEERDRLRQINALLAQTVQGMTGGLERIEVRFCLFSRGVGFLDSRSGFCLFCKSVFMRLWKRHTLYWTRMSSYCRKRRTLPSFYWTRNGKCQRCPPFLAFPGFYTGCADHGTYCEKDQEELEATELAERKRVQAELLAKEEAERQRQRLLKEAETGPWPLSARILSSPLTLTKCTKDTTPKPAVAAAPGTRGRGRGVGRGTGRGSTTTTAAVGSSLPTSTATPAPARGRGTGIVTGVRGQRGLRTRVGTRARGRAT